MNQDVARADTSKSLALHREVQSLREIWREASQSQLRKHEVSALHAWRALAHPRVIAYQAVGALLLMGLFSRFALAAGIALALSLAAVYWFHRAIHVRLEFRRRAISSVIREGDVVEMVFEVRNQSDFELPYWTLEDRFTACRHTHFREVRDPLAARALTRVSYRRHCDSGMGDFHTGPAELAFTDPWGFFEYRVRDDSRSEIRVHPLVVQVDELKVQSTPDNLHFGMHETLGRGVSVNFSGVRPYAQGDSLRQIAWRLSSRGQGLIVKEFERSVAVDVQLVLNFAGVWQLGRDSVSTWELMKDLTLALLRQQIEQGNRVGVYLPQAMHSTSGGLEHFHRVAEQIVDLDRDAILQTPHIDLLEHYHSFFPRRSHIVYISPFQTGELQRSRNSLRTLLAESHPVSVIAIDTHSVWRQHMGDLRDLPIGLTLQFAELDRELMELKNEGVDVQVVRWTSVSDQWLRFEALRHSSPKDAAVHAEPSKVEGSSR